MKKIILTALITSGLLIFGSCKKALDFTPKGTLSAADLTSPSAVEGLVTAAYQTELETKWLENLRAKYTIVINNDVLYSLSE